MICTTLSGSLERILAALDNPYVEMAEIRLDLCNLDEDQIQTLFSGTAKPLIASGAPVSVLCKAAEAGARYIDVPVTVPVEESRAAQEICRKTGTGLIRSWHDFEKTPQRSYLMEITARCVRYGADVVKVCTVCRTAQERDELLGIYNGFRRGRQSARLIAVGMGPEALESRVQALKSGAPWVYACLDGPVAPGQPSVEELHERVYGPDSKSFFRSSLQMPCSKSFAQRAIIAAALCDGTSRLSGYTRCDDSESAIRAAKALGATVRCRGTTLTITGPAKPVRPQSVSAGESGLVARLLIPILAQMGETPAGITGSGTLLKRPLRGAADIMAAFGVMLRNAEPRSGKELYVPLTLKGKMYPGTAEVSGADGSQLISGLLMALPRCDRSSRLFVAQPKSLPYMFITLDVLKRFGIKVSASLDGDAEALAACDWTSCVGVEFSIRGNQRYKPADFRLEGDWSAAAPFLVCGAVFGSAEVCALDTESLQADISILDLLVRAGAGVSYDESAVSVCKGPLCAFDFSFDNCPDLFPCAVVLAMFCEGSSRLRGVSRLRTKESDRLMSVCAMLDGFGVPYTFESDALVVEGHTYDFRLLNGALLKGGRFDSFSDHRIAMALKAASPGADSPVEIAGCECVAKSFPDFFGMWD